MTKYFFVTLVILCIGLKAIGQDYDKDIQGVVDQMEASTGCHIVSEIKVYKDKSSKNAVFSFGSELQKGKDAYRTRIAETELISDGETLIIVDHDEKVVQLQNCPDVSKNDEKFFEELKLTETDKENRDTVLFMGSEGVINSYLVNYKYGEIRSMLIAIDTEKKTISRVEFEYSKKYYPDNSFVVIEYTKFDYNIDFDKDVFLGKDCVQKKGGKYVLTPAYQRYQLINELNS